LTFRRLPISCYTQFYSTLLEKATLLTISDRQALIAKTSQQYLTILFPLPVAKFCLHTLTNVSLTTSMGQYGYLIPDRYVREVPNEVDMNTASIFWGFSLCAAVFTLAKGTQQSWRAWKRRHRVTAYVGMIWVVWLSSMVLGCLAWGFQRQYIAPRSVLVVLILLFYADTTPALAFISRLHSSGHCKSNFFFKSSSTELVF
jgi:hypothetical protein